MITLDRCLDQFPPDVKERIIHTVGYLSLATSVDPIHQSINLDKMTMTPSIVFVWGEAGIELWFHAGMTAPSGSPEGHDPGHSFFDLEIHRVGGEPKIILMARLSRLDGSDLSYFIRHFKEAVLAVNSKKNSTNVTSW